MIIGIFQSPAATLIHAMITIIGATGFTGTLISEIIDRKAQPMRLVARDDAKLKALSGKLSGKSATRLINVHDASSVKAAIDGSLVVINCAGPFTENGSIVVEECIKSGIHYLDITGEQQFTRLVIERFSSLAAQTGSIAIPACAFEYALADCAAAELKGELGELDSFESTYVIEGMYTSRGTKRSVVCALEAAAHQLKNGELQLIKSGNISPFHFGGKTYQRWPFPGGEVYLVPLHADAQNISTFLTAEAPPAVMSFLSGLMPMVAKTPIKSLLNIAIDFSNPSPRRTETSFSIHCKGSSRNQSMNVTISGKDPYYLTAVIAAECASKLASGMTKNGGVVSASMLAGFDLIKTSMLSEGVTWTCE